MAMALLVLHHLGLVIGDGKSVGRVDNGLAIDSRSKCREPKDAWIYAPFLSFYCTLSQKNN